MVPAERVCTGIAGLDSQLGGGVPPGTSILLIADSTNALYQFLTEMAEYGTNEGQSVLWFELDRPWGLFQGTLDKALKGNGRLSVLDAYEPRVGSAKTNGEGPDLTQVSAADVPGHVAKLLGDVEPGNYRLILTSLSALRQTLDERDVLALVRQVVALGHHLGGLQILTLVKDAHPPDEVARLKHACTAVFELGMERKGFGLYSYLKVEKLLGVPDAARLLLFNETDQGLRLESTRRVF